MHTRNRRSFAGRFAALLPLIVLSAAASGAADRDTLIAEGRKPTPPAMTHRDIAPPTTAPAGNQIELADGEYKMTLFVPIDYTLPADGHVDLTVHFHGGIWFPIQEYLRGGLATPLLIGSFGEGSSVYGKPFASDPDRFGRFLADAEQALAHRAGDGRTAHVARIDISSFSAGYGAVREILRQDRFTDRIRRIILCDSLYAGWDPATTQPGATSRPAEENMRPFAKFVEMAAHGERTFVLAHSHVPTAYANTVATAAWIIDLVHAPRTEIHPGDTPAANDDRYPLVYRADLGHLHIWGYAGDDAQAHLTSVRHLADIMRALDACGDGR